MTTQKVLGRLVALSIAVVLVVPTLAFALPGRGALGAGAGIAPLSAGRQAARDQRLALLKQRIVLILQNRKLRFDNVFGRVSAHVEKVSTIAATVEKAGGDVSGVRASLDKARSYLEQAKPAEDKAIAMFRALPDAADKKAAFMAARAQAKTAHAALVNGRIQLRNAILTLRSVANGLKGAKP